MATKKQKRQEALAKRDAFLEERRLSGLQAQRIDRERREYRKLLKAEAEMTGLPMEELRKKRKRPTPADLVTTDQSSTEMECR